MSDSGKPLPNKAIIAIGMLFVAVGIFALLGVSGVLPQGSTAPDRAPSWMGWLICLMFSCAGIIIITRGLTGATDSSGELPASAPPFLRSLNDFLAIVVVCSLATTLTWVAFGPGARHFSTTVGGAGLFFRTSGGSDIPGRIAFGLASVIGWTIAAFMVLGWARRRRR